MNEERELECWEPGCDAPVTLLEQRFYVDRVDGRTTRVSWIEAACASDHERSVPHPVKGGHVLSDEDALEALHLDARGWRLRERLNEAVPVPPLRWAAV